MKIYIPLFLAFSVPSIIVSTPAQAEDIMSILERQQSQIDRPLPPKYIPYSYTVSLDFTEIEGKKSSNIKAVLRIDPSQPAGSRATIVTASDPENEGLEDFIKDIENPKVKPKSQAENFWCGETESDDDVELSDFQVVSETETEATLRPNPGMMAEMMMQSDDEEGMSKRERKMAKKLAERIDGEFVLSKPDAKIKSFKMWMTRPMKVMTIAKIKEMNMTQNCVAAPNGFMRVSQMNMTTRGKALGSTFGQDMKIELSDLTPLP